MKAREADITKPYVDARDGNNARPYCITIAIPAPQPSRLKYRQTFVLRASSPEDAKLVRQFALSARRKAKTLPEFITVIRDAQHRTMELARAAAQARSEAAYKRAAATDPSEQSDQTGNAVFA